MFGGKKTQFVIISLFFSPVFAVCHQLLFKILFYRCFKQQ